MSGTLGFFYSSLYSSRYCMMCLGRKGSFHVSARMSLTLPVTEAGADDWPVIFFELRHKSTFLTGTITSILILLLFPFKCKPRPRAHQTLRVSRLHSIPTLRLLLQLPNKLHHVRRVTTPGTASEKLHYITCLNFGTSSLSM